MLKDDVPVALTVPAGSIALDGEREVAFGERDEVQVTLRGAAFRTIDVGACMAQAATQGLLVQPTERLAYLNQQQGGSL